MYQSTLSNESSVGWCRPEGEGCAVGVQPGCECLREGSLYSCDLYSSPVLCPTAQDDTCTCVLPTDLDPPAADNLSCPTS